VRRLLIIAAIVAGTAAVAGIVVYGQMHASLLTDRKATPIKPADRKPAPAFSRAGLSGPAVDLRRFAGRPVVINFFASWCVPCRQEAAGLARLGRDFGSRVQMLGIAIDDKRPGAMRFVSHYHWTWPIVFDPDDDLAFRYNLLGKPTTVILDQQGRIAWQHAGKIGTRPIAEVLDALLRA
jgi:cytochrome c biogenesis protein CcmG/thiol:disulfide interchange protein DsbE